MTATRYTLSSDLTADLTTRVVFRHEADGSVTMMACDQQVTSPPNPALSGPEPTVPSPLKPRRGGTHPPTAQNF